MLLDGTDSLGLDIPSFTETLCAETDPEIFFPEKGGSVRQAVAVCRRCDGQPECLEYALTRGEHYGIWGGVVERERRRMARDRGLRGQYVPRQEVREIARARRDSVRQLYDAGYGPTAIAEALDLDPEIVRKDLQHNTTAALDESA